MLQRNTVTGARAIFPLIASKGIKASRFFSMTGPVPLRRCSCVLTLVFWYSGESLQVLGWFRDFVGIPKSRIRSLLASITSLNLANAKQIPAATDNEVDLWLVRFAHRVTVRPRLLSNLVVASGRSVLD